MRVAADLRRVNPWMSTRLLRDASSRCWASPSREFLTLLASNDTVRADAFRQVYERGGKETLLDSLHDLEADPVMRGWLVEYLRMGLARHSIAW